METLHKNILDNTVPTLKTVSENGRNHTAFVIASYVIIGLLVGSLPTTLIANTIKLRKHIKQQKDAK